MNFATKIDKLKQLGKRQLNDCNLDDLRAFVRLADADADSITISRELMESVPKVIEEWAQIIRREQAYWLDDEGNPVPPEWRTVNFSPDRLEELVTAMENSA